MKTFFSSRSKFFNYAVVVPCYNEEQRLPCNTFLDFAKANPNVMICLVNDGSKDHTLAILRGMEFISPDNIVVYDMPKNGGKAEAVRRGMLYVKQNFKTHLIGFLDADLATTLDEWLEMAEYKMANQQYGVIVGSRIQRLGANIARDDNRSFFSFIIKQFIHMIVQARFQDTQCGAKIFHSSLVSFLFNKPFMTQWFFDIEIFLRLQKKFGKNALQNGVLEFPLLNWVEVGDSRLKLIHMIKIPIRLLRLYYTYRIQPKMVTKTGYSWFSNSLLKSATR